MRCDALRCDRFIEDIRGATSRKVQVSANRCVQALASRLSPLTDIGAFGAAQLDADERQLKSSVRSLAPLVVSVGAARLFSCLLPPASSCLLPQASAELELLVSRRAVPLCRAAFVCFAALRCTATSTRPSISLGVRRGVSNSSACSFACVLYVLQLLRRTEWIITELIGSALFCVSSPLLSVAFRFSIAQWELDAVTSCSQCSVQYAAVDSL